MRVSMARSTFTERSDFAKLVRPYLRSAMADAAGNYTQATVILNEGNPASSEGKPWDRRSVAAVVRRLQALKL
jgi:hypothetical protein